MSMSEPSRSFPYLSPRILDRVAGALLGLALVLLLRRYVGINHDAIVYLGQALVRRWPDIYGNDLFFIHGGSQDHYTLFPRVLSLGLHWLEPVALFMAGALAGILLFAAAGWVCIKVILPERQRYWAWLGVLCLPTSYGLNRMFGYSEQFFTSRPMAESLGLLAVGLVARGRHLAAMACLGIAALFHPLQAIAAALVVWTWLVIGDRRWLHAAWAGLPVLVLAMSGIGPFGDLLRQADPAWLYILRDNSPQLFLARWGVGDFHALALDALILAYCWRTLDSQYGRWCLAALLALAAGVLANLLLVDGLHFVLPAGLQLWRVHWLAHWMAMAGFAVLVHHELADGDPGRAAALVLAALMAWTLAEPAWLLVAAGYAAWPRLAMGRPWMKRLLGWSCAAGILLLAANYAYSEFTMFRIAHYRLDLYAFDRRLLVFPAIGLGLAFLAAHGWQRLKPRGQALAIALVLCPLAATAALRWDSRPPEVRAIEGAAFRQDVFGVRIPPHAQVYWSYDNLLGTWLVLGRASYFSPHQLSGQVFNRAMAMDGRARLDRLYPLLREYLGCQDRSRSVADRERCHIGDAAMRQACLPSAANPPPDYIVLPYHQPQRPIGSWAIVDPVTQRETTRFRLHRCADVARELESGTGTP